MHAKEIYTYTESVHLATQFAHLVQRAEELVEVVAVQKGLVFLWCVLLFY